MSFYRMGGDHEARGDGLPSPIEETYTSLCLSLACSLLVETRDELHVLFEGLAKQEVVQPDPQQVEEKIAEALANDDKFPVGASMAVLQSDKIRIEVKRVDVENIEILYYHMPSNALVLRRLDGERGVGLTDLDPYFWTIEVDGMHVTEELLEQVDKAPYAFKVDHINLKLSLKAER